jgi:replicative DNA helicase
VPFLKPQHFYEARHRYIYAAMAAPCERAAAIDYHTIAEELQRQGTYEQPGGLVHLSEVNLSTPTAAHIEHYARIVLEHAVRPRYITLGLGSRLLSSRGTGVKTSTRLSSAPRRWC